MKPNIGIVNSLIRITCGLTLLSWSTAKFVRKPNHSMPLLVAMAGAMKVAEGFTRFCPITYMIQEQAIQIQKQNNENKQQNEPQTNFADAFNPY
ncbi:YgaP family membrane protein [Alkalihalobacterium bogoriense]|uniref:YgaP family membrane protein n=1 Tax=Alkalihalobacterium bogoriense TaxID=246272 RepID=UPI00047E83DD|nr:DUF2892 domain-containing protein [Alkalihalobacterium bogoriense]